MIDNEAKRITENIVKYRFRLSQSRDVKSTVS